MKTLTKTAALFSSLLALASVPAQASVSLSIDTGTTQTSTTWSGSPAGTLAQSIDLPSAQNSQDGGVSSGIIFKAGSSFTLGAIEIDEAFYTGGTGNFNLFMYDLGSSYTLPGTSPVYTFTGSEPDLLSAGDNVSLTSAHQFDVFTFSGADNVSMVAGDSYLFDLVASDGVSSLTWERGPVTPNQDIAVNSTQVGGAGTVLNNGGTGANRTPVAAFFAEPVPEPTSLALVGGGFALLGLMRRSKK